MNNQDIKINYNFRSDRSINSKTQDILGRTKFVKEISHAIRNWNEEDGLVLAIYGKWGEGKTSVKNLVLENLSENQNYITLEFNPWQWSGEADLTEKFFKELSIKLDLKGGEQEKKLAAQLSNYAKYIKLGRQIVERYSKVIDYSLKALSVGFFGAFSIKANENISYMFLGLSFFLGMTSIILKETEWGFDLLRQWKLIGVEEKLTLIEQKKQIGETLKSLKKNILIVLDDLDRLNKIEIRQLFKLIKANADFPQTVYLTLFQRDIIENSLEEDKIFSGSEYLKKIVQVGFDLPKVPPEAIHKKIFQELDKLLAEGRLEDKFDNARWNQLFLEGLSQYFKNLRDVNRFISIFSFHLEILKEKNTFEVNFIDLMGIEVLRQFEPKVYQSIFDHKEFFTKSSSGSGKNYNEKEEKEMMHAILGFSKDENRNSLKVILEVLFPNVKWAMGSNYFSSVDKDDFVNLRVNHPERFDRYFIFNLLEGEIPQSDFEFVLNNSNDKEKLTTFFSNLKGENKLDKFIAKFNSFQKKINHEHCAVIGEVLLELGDQISDMRDGGFYSISSLRYLKYLIDGYFLKEEFSQNRQETFWNLMKSTKAVYLPLEYLTDEYSKRSVEKYPEHYFLKDIDAEDIKALILEKIKNNIDQIPTNIHFARIIYYWISVDSDNAHKWFNKYISDDNKFVDFVRSLEQVGYSSSGFETKTYHFINNNYLNTFFPDMNAFFSRINSIMVHFSETQENFQLKQSIYQAEDRFKNPNANDRF